MLCFVKAFVSDFREQELIRVLFFAFVDLAKVQENWSLRVV
jgi:hypothetical protein